MTTRTWRVLIADDEPIARRGVRQLLAAFPQFSIAGECKNGAEVLTMLPVHQPDVLFLDIQMPGLDGLNLAKQLQPRTGPSIVFLTAYDHFAVPAFEVDATDYLLKPVTDARFAVTIKRLTARLTATADEATIAVPTSTGTSVIQIHEIEWIEAAGNYSRIWSSQRRELLHRQPLQQLEEQLVARGFMRAHRQALVRIAAVKELKQHGTGMTAILRGGAIIRISRRRQPAFCKAVRDGVTAGSSILAT